MTAWILWVAMIAGSGISQQAALFPTEEMCEAAATKIHQNISRMTATVKTVCTETRIVR